MAMAAGAGSDVLTPKPFLNLLAAVADFLDCLLNGAAGLAGFL
jgi:hypothetical protein